MGCDFFSLDPDKIGAVAGGGDPDQVAVHLPLQMGEDVLGFGQLPDDLRGGQRFLQQGKGLCFIGMPFGVGKLPQSGQKSGIGAFLQGDSPVVSADDKNGHGNRRAGLFGYFEGKA